MCFTPTVYVVLTITSENNASVCSRVIGTIESSSKRILFLNGLRLHGHALRIPDKRSPLLELFEPLGPYCDKGIKKLIEYPFSASPSWFPSYSSKNQEGHYLASIKDRAGSRSRQQKRIRFCAIAKTYKKEHNAHTAMPTELLFRYFRSPFFPSDSIYLRFTIWYIYIFFIPAWEQTWS